MKHVILLGALAMAFGLNACSSKPVIMQPAPALREIFRGGEIQGLEDNSSQYTGMPNAYDQVEHVCTSQPIYDMYGRYVRTSVKCW